MSSTIISFIVTWQMSELHLQTLMPQEPAATDVDDVKKVQFWRATPPQPIWTENILIKETSFKLLLSFKIRTLYEWEDLFVMN